MVILAAHKVFNTPDGEPLVNLPAVLLILGVLYYAGVIYNKTKKKDDSTSD